MDTVTTLIKDWGCLTAFSINDTDELARISDFVLVLVY